MQKHYRYCWVDIAKVFSIFGVVFIHSSGVEIVMGLFNTCVVYSIAVLLSCLISALGGRSLVR